MLFPIFNNYRLVGGGGGGAVPVVAESVQSIDSGGGSTDNLSITFGTAPVAGDYIVLIATSGGGGGPGNLAAPSGFDPHDLTFADHGVFVRKSNGTEGATFTVGTFNEAGILYGLRITGTNASIQIDQMFQNSSSTDSPSVTTTGNNCLLLAMFFSTSSNSTVTVPSGWTSLQTASVTSAHGGPIRCTVASSSKATAGATGVATWSRTAEYAIMMAIRP